MTTGIRFVDRRETCEGCGTSVSRNRLHILQIGNIEHNLCIPCIYKTGIEAKQYAMRVDKDVARPYDIRDSQSGIAH